MSSATDEKPRATAETPAGPPPPAGGGEGGGRDLETGATVAAAAGSSGSSRERLAPSASFTGHQLFYVFALDGFGGMALSAGVNFALAYGEFCARDRVIPVWLTVGRNAKSHVHHAGHSEEPHPAMAVS